MKIGDKEFKLEPDLEVDCSGCHFLRDGDCTNPRHSADCVVDGKPMVLTEVKK